MNPPPLITDVEKGYCSCPPFECVCTFNHSLPSTNYQPYNQHSPDIYQQPQYVESYWTPDQTHITTFPSESSTTNPQYDFANISTDLFQPEEIFQLDQPIKPDFITNSQSDIARSPPTLLDLGSGTIHREYKNEEYWHPSIPTFMNEDSNNSSNSRFLSSPDNSQLSINNNITGQNTLTNFMETSKGDEFFQKYDQKQLNNYYVEASPKNAFGEIESKTMFDDGFTNVLDFQNIKPNLKQTCGFENKPDKYQDLTQYIDYNMLSVYDNKISSNDGIFNDLDFRINYPAATNIPYSSHDNFEILPH